MVIYYHVMHGMLLISLTVLLHAVGSRYFLWSVLKYKPFLQRHPGFLLSTLVLTWAVGNLIILHMLEILGWGCYYYGMGLFQDFEASVYYSLVTYTTVGYGDVVLPREWRLMGTSEALVGILMTAWSTALLIGVLSRFHQKILEKIAREHEPARTSEDGGPRPRA
jgi:hypothetical protein